MLVGRAYSEWLYERAVREVIADAIALAHVVAYERALLRHLKTEGLTIAPRRAKPGPRSKRDEVLAWIGDRPVTLELKAPARKRFDVKRPTLERWLRQAKKK